MKITSYEQAVEALKAVFDYFGEDREAFMLAIVGKDEDLSCFMAGKGDDLVPAISLSMLDDEVLRDVIEDAVLAANDKNVVNAYNQYNENNLMN